MTLRALAAEKPKGIGDAALVAAALDGEKWAKTALFRRHGRRVGGLVARLLGSTQDVEDIVNDSFLRAFVELEKLVDPSAFKPWVTQIAVNRTRKVLRRRKLERFLGLHQGDDDAALARLHAPDSGEEARADLAFIDRVLQKAPTKERIAWMLRVVEGYSLKEVSELCGCSLATAKRRIRSVQNLVRDQVTVKGGRHG